MHFQIDLSMQSDFRVRHRRQLGMDLILFPLFSLSFLIKKKYSWWTISFLTRKKDVMIDYLLTNPSRMKEEGKRPIRLRLIFSEPSNGNNQQSLTLPQIYTFHKAMPLKRSCLHWLSKSAIHRENGMTNKFPVNPRWKRQAFSSSNDST